MLPRPARPAGPTKMKTMRRLPLPWALLGLALLLSTAAARAQPGAAPGPADGAPAAVPGVESPATNPLRGAVPRVVQAVGNTLGQGRQRLALVVGVGTVGARSVLHTASHDTQAVAAALRAGGFVVMLREDINGDDLRTSLHEFRTRLQPGGLGFVYFTGLAAQRAGRNLLLPRDARLDADAGAAAMAAQLATAGVPLQDLVAALGGVADGPRLLVVDAAYSHPALAGLPQAGLAEPVLLPGVMALFGDALATTQPVPAVAPPPAGAANDPAAMAASRFARVLVAALVTPRISGAEALRRTRRAIVEASGGQTRPWLGGATDDREELAEATLLDGLLPRTPEDLAREGFRQLTRLAGPEAGAPAAAPGPASPPGTAEARTESTAAQPASPGGGSVDALGTAAGLAGSVATLAAGVKLAETAAALSAAGSAAHAAVAVADTAAGAGKRLLASGGGATPARAPAPAAGAAVLPAGPPPAGAAAVTPAPLAATAVAAAAAAMPAAAAAAGPAAGAGATGGHALAGAPAALLAARAADHRTQRMPEGGERPRFVPRVNNFGHAEGDTYTYQTIDTWKDELLDSHTTAIDEVMGDGELMANGQTVQMDPQGRLKSLRSGDGSVTRWVPHQDLWWARPQAGESRALQFTETIERPGAPRSEVRWSGTARVGAARRLQTPAGEFEALPIASSGWTTEALPGGATSSHRFKRTVWYAPRLGQPVRIDIEDADATGQLLRRERVELMHAQQARDTP